MVSDRADRPEHADRAARVRTALLEAGFTADGVLARVGSAAFAALGRGTVVPVRRALVASGHPGSTAGATATTGPDTSTGPGPTGGPAATSGSPEAGVPTAPTGEPRSVPSATALLDRLIELLLLSDPLPGDALPPALVEDLAGLGIVRADAETITPLLEVRPYGEPDTDWYLVNDIGAPTTPDHVLGVGGASLTLARITPRRDVGRALDLGCGSGVQLLHAARHATRVVGTDTNPRALAMAALSAALSGVPAEQVDLRDGSLFGPVSDERFDLVVSNPPFVISPSHRFTYRDAGLPGDELSRLVVRGAAAHLSPGGMAAVLGNWLHVTGEDWAERVAEWVSGTGVSAWIVQRDSQPVAEYAATWLRDAGVPEGPEFDAAMDEWLDAFDDEQCDQVGFGWFVLVAPPATGGAAAAPSATAGSGSYRPDGAEPWVLVEDLAHGERLPRGDEVLAFISGCATVEALPAPALLASRSRLADGTTVTTTTHVSGGAHVDAPPRLGLAGTVGPGGWRAAVTVPPALLAALLGNADTPIGERLDDAAQAEGLDPLDVLGPALMALRELVRVGIVRTD